MQVTVKGNSSEYVPALMINPISGLLILTAYPLLEGRLSGTVIDSGSEPYRKGIFWDNWEPKSFRKFEGSIEICNEEEDCT